MKRTTLLFSLLALVFCATSCQDADLDNNQNLGKELTITATIADPNTSRVTLTDNGETLHPQWTVNDNVIGFDEAGAKFTFKVDAVTDGRAAMSVVGEYTPVDGRKVYAIYAPGKSVSDISESQLTVSIASQEGLLDENAPFLMCATATTEGSSINLVFENKVAAVGLKKFKVNPVAAATTIDQLLLDGAIAAGTFQVVSGNLELVPAGAPATITAAGTWETDATGLYDAPVYFAVLPTADANLELHAASGSDSYVNLASIAQTTLEAGYYYRMSKILDAVADVNGTKYASIDAAWAAANAATSDVTVTLLANCTAASTLTLDNSESGTGAVTLDLNGKTLTGYTGVYAISVQNERSLTIEDSNDGGSIRTDYQGVNKGSGSSLAIEGGQIESAQQCIYAEGSGVAEVTGGIFHSSSAAAVTSDGSTVRVHGGKFSSDSKTTALMSITNSGKLYVWEPTVYDRPLISNRTAKNDGSGTYIRYNTLTDDDEYPFTVKNITAVDAIITKVSGSSNTYRSSMEAAARHAKMALADITLTPNGNNTTPHPAVDLTNDEGHTVTLDLVGKTMTTTSTQFIKTSGALFITDSGTPKGSISSTMTQVIYIVQEGADVTLDGCKITTSATSASNYYQYGPVNLNAATSKITIKNGAVISTAGSVTVITNRAGTLIIDDAVVSSGTESSGWIAVANGGADAHTTINGGSFYTSSSTATRPVVYNGANIGSGGTAGDITINGGYFYSTLEYDIRSSQYVHNPHITINGGHFAHSTDWSTKPTYGEGKTLQVLSPAETHVHAGKEYTYNYIVADKPSEGEASLDEPVANYGGAQTGINF